MSEQATVIPNLSVEEISVLAIAATGASMIPIGRWEVPVLSLALRGLMTRIDSVNYLITAAGRMALEEIQQADMAQLEELRLSHEGLVQGVSHG